MVVVAVTTAVAARVPHFDAQQWTFHIGVGVIMGCAAIAAVWLVCARLPLWLRLVVAPFLLVLFVLAMRVLIVSQYLVYYWFNDPSSISRYWQQVQKEGVWHGGQHWAVAFSLSLLLTCGWLTFAVRAGWFDPFHEADWLAAAEKTQTRSARMAGWSALALFGLISLLPLALLYRLLTPVPVPEQVLPTPNGYDDLIAAGEMISEADSQTLTYWSNLSDDQLRAMLAKYASAFDRMQDGLERQCAYPYLKTGSWAPPFQRLYIAAGARAGLARRAGTLEEKVSASWDLLRIAYEATRGAGAHWNGDWASQWQATEDLWACRAQLSAAQCVELAAKLSKFDAARESWASMSERQRAFDANSGWEGHLNLVLPEWSGNEPYASDKSGHRSLVAQVRILIVELGVLAYQRDNARLPNALTDLVPKYLPAVPPDPYGSGAIKYRAKGNNYTLYSVGPDETDDGGQPYSAHSEKGDLMIPDLFPWSAQPATPGPSQSTATATDDQKKSQP